MKTLLLTTLCSVGLLLSGCATQRLANDQGQCPPPENEPCYTENGSRIATTPVETLYAPSEDILAHLRPNPISPIGTTTIKSPVFTWRANGNSNYILTIVNDNNNGLVSTTNITASAAGCADGSNHCTFKSNETLAAGNYRWSVFSGVIGDGMGSDDVKLTVK